MSYLINFIGNIKQRSSGILFVKTDSTTVANTATESSLVGNGVGSITLPTNFLTVGRTLRIRGFGYHSSTGNPTFTIRFKLGSTTVGTVTGTSGNGSNDGFEFDGILTCRTIGSSGTVQAQGSYRELQSNGLIAGGGNTSTTTINTTLSHTIAVTVQWGTADAGNTITLTNMVIESLV